MTLRGHRYVVSRSPQDASVLSHKYLTRCAAPFRAGRRCASSPVPFNCLRLVGAPCPARKFAGGSSKVFMGQDTDGFLEGLHCLHQELEFLDPRDIAERKCKIDVQYIAEARAGIAEPKTESHVFQQPWIAVADDAAAP